MGNDVGPWITAHRSDSLGSWYTTSRASFVNGESTQNTRRVSWLQARSVSETASVMTGRLGSVSRAIHSRSGHSAGSLLIVDTIIAVGGSSANKIWIETVWGGGSGRPRGSVALEFSESWKPRVVDGTELQHLENIRGYGVLIGIHLEFTHPSGVLSGLGPFCFRRNFLESLSNQTVE